MKIFPQCHSLNSTKAEIEEIKNTLSIKTDLRGKAEKERQEAIDLLDRLKVQHIEDTERLTASVRS